MRRAADSFARLWLALLLALLTSSIVRAGQNPIRVCADPDNLPVSNTQGEGFENKLAVLVARELGRPLAYVWSPHSESVREALDERRCDLVIGVPLQLGGVETTRPYYWSSYVLVSRADRGLDITSLKDKRLRQLKIGVAAIGEDAMYTPPAHALAQSGLADNLIGYRIDGDRADRNGEIVAAVARGDIDIGAQWGPLAGYFAQRSPTPLTMTMIGDTDEFSARKTHFELLGLQYEIAMAVREGDDALRDALDEVIARRKSEIKSLLTSFGVPLIEPEQLSSAAAPAADRAD